jgi:hypothetical protein
LKSNAQYLLQFLLHTDCEAALPLLAERLESTYTAILMDSLLMLLGCQPQIVLLQLLLLSLLIRCF